METEIPQATIPPVDTNNHNKTANIVAVVALVLAIIGFGVYAYLSKSTREFSKTQEITNSLGYKLNLDNYPFEVKELINLDEKKLGSVTYCWVTEVKEALKSDDDMCQKSGMLFLFKIFVSDEPEGVMIQKLGSKNGRYYYLFHLQDYQEYFDQYPDFKLPSFDAFVEIFVIADFL